MGMGMGLNFENPMGMGMGMGMIFENRYGCGYSYTRPKPAQHPSLPVRREKSMWRWEQGIRLLVGLRVVILTLRITQGMLLEKWEK